MNIHLTPELAHFARSKVESGRHNSPGEVVREALLLMQQRDDLRSVELQELRNRMDAGLSEAERGQGLDGEQFMQGLIEDLDRRKANRKAG